MSHSVLRFGVTFLVIASAITTKAETLFALKAAGSSGSILSRVSTLDGLTMDVGLTSEPAAGTLAYDPSLDSLLTIANQSRLISVDRSSGASVELADLGVRITSLVYDWEDNELLGIDVISDTLYRIDPSSNTTTAISSIDQLVSGAAFDRTTNTLFTVDNITNSLYTLDKLTGVTSLIGNIGHEGVLSVAADPISGELWAFDVGANGTLSQLLNLDKSTGAGTPVGPPAGSGFIASLSYAPAVIPEPRFAAFLFVACLLFAFGRGRTSAEAVKAVG
ncbi:MAG: hypothetical protein AAGJ40_09130 [Planctomycetota bacterium]